jgi:hypothetical protein
MAANDGSTLETALLHAARAVLALCAFAAGTLLSAPATVCLLPGPAPGTSQIPDYMQYAVTSAIIALVSFIQSIFPQLVYTDPQGAANDPLLPHA